MTLLQKYDEKQFKFLNLKMRTPLRLTLTSSRLGLGIRINECRAVSVLMRREVGV